MPSESRGAALAATTERMIGWFRIIGGLVGIVLTVTDQVVHPDLERNVEVGSLAVLALVGVATVVWLREPRDPDRLRRWMVATYVVDALVLLAQLPLHAFVALEAPSAALLVPLLGAVRFGYRGAWPGIVGVAAASVLRGTLAVEVHGLPFGIDPAVVTTLLAAIIGLITAHLYTTAHAGRRDAEAATEAALQAQHMAEEAGRRAGAAHRVLAAGVGGGVATVARRLAEALRAETGASGVRIVLDRGDDSEEPEPLRAASGRFGDEPPVEHDVTYGESVIGRLELAAPRWMQQDLPEFAHEIGLAVHAARLLDEEAALAARHRALDLMRTDFVALTTHELRTPVAAVLAAAETLLTHRPVLDAAQVEELHRLIRRQGQRLEGLVQDLLTVGRSDAGTLDYRAKYVAITDLVEEALAQLGRSPQVDGDGDVVVWIDPERGVQVLLNVLANAYEHGAEPVSVSWEAAADGWARIEVVDAGPGIPEDLHDTVFERFVQLDPMEHHTGGSGLGLGISRDLTRAMGGDVRIDLDRPSTTFVVELPQHPVGAMPVDE